MFEWKKEYELGIDFVDEQHKRLLEIGRKAYELITNEFYFDKFDKIVEIINELESYTEYHFTCEEEYLQEKKYRKLLSHKVEHSDFIKKLQSLDLTELDQSQDKHLAELLNFIGDWITDHILVSDKHYAENIN